MTEREILQDTWHEGMTNKEEEIYFCKMKVLNTRKYQDEDRLLVCSFGLCGSLLAMNRFHKDMEKASTDQLKKLELL